MDTGLIARLLGRAAPEDAPPPSRAPERRPAEGQAALRDALAAKVLHDWAQNRQQVLVPLTVNLARMDRTGRGLLVGAMAAALAADGEVTPADRRRMEAVLGRIGADAADRDAARHALDRPPDVFVLLAALEAASLGAHAYAASALVLERRGEVARHWLCYLAARFALPGELVSRLSRRYRG
jgi:uncharacterized membrane protein YebE (DUF533 family)